MRIARVRSAARTILGRLATGAGIGLIVGLGALTYATAKMWAEQRPLPGSAMRSIAATVLLISTVVGALVFELWSFIAELREPPAPAPLDGDLHDRDLDHWRP